MAKGVGSMISLTITIERTHNGRTVKSQALLHENGWQQWGETRERLAETVPLVEALQYVFMGEGLALDEEETD
jgi:hypothetical protein